MRQVCIAVALAASGCNSVLGIEDLTLASDAGPPEPDAAGHCYGTLVTACFASPPAGAIELIGEVNTDAVGTGCLAVGQLNGSTVCAIAGESITIAAGGATIVGSKPLMLIATGTIAVTGDLDASSVQMRSGAGANSTRCLPAVRGAPGADGGGGAGGSFVHRGGDGGQGANPGAGGVANPAQLADVLRGGCPGGQGGNASGLGGAGGAGGGALYLVGGAITIGAEVRATGAGGRGASTSDNGGGGGGSGGMIALEAPAIMLLVDGELTVSGGGGGEGASNNNAGDSGTDDVAWDEVPAGGGGSSSGGDGGDGGYLAVPAEAGKVSLAGGGGGGGGAGIVWVKGALTGPTPLPSSPAPTITN